MFGLVHTLLLTNVFKFIFFILTVLSIGISCCKFVVKEKRLCATNSVRNSSSLLPTFYQGIVATGQANGLNLVLEGGGGNAV